MINAAALVNPLMTGLDKKFTMNPSCSMPMASCRSPIIKASNKGKCNVLPCARDSDSRQACSHQKAVHGHRSHGQMAGGAEKSVNDLRHKCRVQSIHNRKPRNHGIGHALGNQHHAHGQSRGPVAAPVRFGIRRQPSG